MHPPGGHLPIARCQIAAGQLCRVDVVSEEHLQQANDHIPVAAQALGGPAALEAWLDRQIQFDAVWESKVVERILHNMSLLMDRSFSTVQELNRYRKELAATLAAARGAFPGQRLALAFQPHRYTRTRDCFEDFVKVLGTADAVLLTEVYAAGEAPIVAADGRALTRAVRVAGKVEPVFVDEVSNLPEAIAANTRNGDVVICMGAGSIGTVAGKTAELLKEKTES